MELPSANHLQVGWLNQLDIKDVRNLAREKGQPRVIHDLGVPYAQYGMAHRHQGVLALVVLRGLLGILNGMVVIAVILCRKAHLVPRKVQLHAVLARKVTP